MTRNPQPRRPERSSLQEGLERGARWAFGLVPQCGGAVLQRLLEAFGSAVRAWEGSAEALRAVPGIGSGTVEAIRGFSWQARLCEEEERVSRAGLHVIVWGDAEYPELLRHIASPPPVLYLRGTLIPEDAAAVAIVGARHATAYGEEVAHALARELARRGLTIVSGLARGIDAAAHRGALEAGGRTLSVLGSGLDRIYPPEHQGLADEVAGAGALLSEFPLGTAPLKPHFPQRNRIISGLSLGVIVAEASVDSGALITAHHALEQGRDVFAVPGRVHARYSEGCNRLIKAGAKLVESWEDVLSELVPHVKGRRRMPAPQASGPALGAEEQRVFDLLAGGPLHIDELIVRGDLPSGRVAAVLVGLEMKGVVRQLRGKRFERRDSG